MKRENILKASELDSRILAIDQELVQLSNKNSPEIVVPKKLLPKLYEEVRLKKIEALANLKAAYLKQIEEMS